MGPWNASMGSEAEKPVVKLTTAEADRVPPAPWVKISAGGGRCDSEGPLEPGGLERKHGIGLLAFAGLAIVNEDCSCSCFVRSDCDSSFGFDALLFGAIVSKKKKKKKKKNPSHLSSTSYFPTFFTGKTT